MDPNATLTNMRNAVKEFRAVQHQSTAEEPVGEAAHSMADAFEALDGWLTGRGFLPDAWTSGVVDAESVDDYDKRLFEAIRAEITVTAGHYAEEFPAEPILAVFSTTEYANGYFFADYAQVHLGTGIDPVDLDFDREVSSLLSDIAPRYSIGRDAGLTVNLRTGEVEFHDYIDCETADAIADRIKSTGATS